MSHDKITIQMVKDANEKTHRAIRRAARRVTRSNHAEKLEINIDEAYADEEAAREAALSATAISEALLMAYGAQCDHEIARLDVYGNASKVMDTLDTATEAYDQYLYLVGGCQIENM